MKTIIKIFLIIIGMFFVSQNIFAAQVLWVEFDYITPTTIESGDSIFGKVAAKVSCSAGENQRFDMIVDYGDGTIGKSIGNCECFNPPFGSELIIDCSADFSYQYNVTNTEIFTVTPEAARYMGNSIKGDSVQVTVLKEFIPQGQDAGNPLTYKDTAEAIEGITDVIFWIFSALALVFLILGGITIITASGIPTTVSKGKRIITATLIGYVIILIAKGIVDLFMNILTG